MVFRGTRTLEDAHAQSLAFERLGATLYAATHVDHGLMSVSVPPSNLDRVLELLGEVAVSPRFADIEVERGIVHEEILEDLDDEGRVIDADNLARALMYGNHALGFSITGDLETLSRFDEPCLRAHHAAHYTGENAVLCIAGAMGNPDRVTRRVEQAFGSLPQGTRIPAEPPTRAAQSEARFRFVENQSSQTDLRLAFRAPSDRDASEPAAEMLLRVLDDGMSTRLYERVCDRGGLCYDVSGMFEAYEDDGVIDVAAGVHHERVTDVLQAVIGVLSGLTEEGPTDAEMNKARDRHLWSTEAMRDDADELAGFYGLAALTQTARSPEERHAELSSVTRQDVQKAAASIFQREGLSAIAVGLLSPAEERRIERVIRAL